MAEGSVSQALASEAPTLGGDEVWLGDCLDEGRVDAILVGRKADAVIFDAPYSKRTHNGHRDGKLTADRAAAFAKRDTGNTRTRERAYVGRKAAKGFGRVRDINYAPWSTVEIRKFCDIWVPRSNGWIVTLTDDVLAPAWRTAFVRHGLYPFAPIPHVEIGSRVRMSGDGPSNWSCWVVVARPRSKEWAAWGTLPGAYVVPGERRFNSNETSFRVVGGKPLTSMLAIVRDYSAPGALVVDPTCGAGTTLVAAKMLGRTPLGMDVSIDHAGIALNRLKATRLQAVMPWAEREVRQLTITGSEGSDAASAIDQA